MRGSGGLEQLAFNVVAVENEVMPDGTRGRVRLKVLKNREWGDLGICDTLMQGEGYRDWETDRKSTRLNSSHSAKSRMPSSA